MSVIKKSIVILLCASFLSACASTSEENGDQAKNRGLKTGAAGGALIGLTMGAITGDAKFAVQAAALGAATGAAAGAAADYQNDREDHRNENKQQTITLNGQNIPAQAAQPSTPQTWDKINNFVGAWQVDIWANNAQGGVNEATADANGTLLSTSTASFIVEKLEVSGQKQDLSGKFLLSYTAEDGYGLTIDFSNNEKLSFAGEYHASQNKYSYYPLQAKGTTLSGEQRSNMRIELRFAGNNIFLVETYVMNKGKEQQVQSYRFTKTS